MAKKQPGRPRSKASPKNRRSSGGITFIAVIIGVALLFVVAFALLKKPSAPVATGPAKVPTTVARELASVPMSTFNLVGSAAATKPKLVAGTKITGKVPFVYIGAEYCPYCAAARWSMIVALSRFGSFSNLHLMRSSSTDQYPNTPTYTFYKSTYTSPYVSFQPVEIATNKFRNGQPVPLQHMNAAQSALLQKFDVPPYVPSANYSGSIPFILIGHRYLLIGSPYSPQVLAGSTWPQIAGQLAYGTSSAAGAILANANEYTAAICALDGGKPAAVCTSSGVKSANLNASSAP